MNAPARLVDTPTRHRFSVDEVARMVDAGLIDPDARIELLDGELIDMPSEGEAHLALKILLNRFFVRGVGEAVWAAPDATLHLAPDNAPEPDLYLLAAGSPLKPVDPASVHLVVEIADSSLAHDLARKSGLYASHGIVEYWVVDVAARLTHVLRRPEGGAYREVRPVGFDEALQPLRLPDLRLVISALPGLALESRTG